MSCVTPWLFVLPRRGVIRRRRLEGGRVSTVELIFCWFCLVAGPPLLWLAVRHRVVWPLVQDVPSPRRRMLFGVSACVFFASFIGYAAIRLADHYALIGNDTETLLGALLAIPFFVACVPLIWWRISRLWA